MKHSRMRRPAAVRIGMFCRLGSFEESRPGDRGGLRVGRVHPPGGRVDAPRQLVGVGRLELGERAVLEDQPRQRMVERQLGERILVGRGLPRRRLLLHRQLLPLEQDLLDLLGRAEVEGLAGRGVGLLFFLQDLLAELVALRLELRPVEQHAVALHAEQHRQRRHLDRAVDEVQLLVLLDLREQQLVQGEDAVGLAGRVLGGARDVHRGERNARGALAGDLVVAEQRPAAMALRERAEVVALVDFEHVGLEQRVVRAAGEPHAVVGERMRIELHVLAHLACSRRARARA